tara:strand:+ start:124 stop:330 length:207 start_codon:yes stop_codon:yes gene_type:complete
MTGDKGRCNMADAKTYVYEVYTTRLDTEQMVLIQIFRDPDDGQVLHAQLAFKNAIGDSWGTPYQLEKK